MTFQTHAVMGAWVIFVHYTLPSLIAKLINVNYFFRIFDMGVVMTVQEQNTEMVCKIRDLCKSVGISIKALEEALGFPNATIGKWENAKKPAPFERVAQVANFFGVSVPFLRGEGGMPNEGSGLSSRAMIAALLFDQSEGWVQEQVLSFLRAAIDNCGGRA